MTTAILVFAAGAVLSPLLGGEISKALYDSVPFRTASYAPGCGSPDLDTTPSRYHAFRVYVDNADLRGVRRDGELVPVEFVSDGNGTNSWTYADTDIVRTYHIGDMTVVTTNETRELESEADSVTEDVVGVSRTAFSAFSTDIGRGILPADGILNRFTSRDFDLDRMRFYSTTGYWTHAINYARDEPSTAHDKDALAVLKDGCTAESYARASYGEGWDMQVRRAIYERALDFAEPVNQTAMIARMDYRNLPCLPPGAPRGRFSVWKAVYGTRYDKGQPVIWTGRMAWHADAIGALIDRYSHVRNVHASIPEASLEACARNDGDSRSYSLYPIGVVIHRGQDAAEELAHFHNFAFPHDSSPCTTFSTPGGNYVTTWDEFAAAYRGLKVDAWRRGIDLGKPGAAREYAASMLDGDALAGLSSRVPANSFKLILVYGEALSDEGTNRDNDDRVKIRSWMDSDSVGRKIL